MNIEKSIIISAAILGLAYFATPIALEAYKMKQCTDTGRGAEICIVILHKKG